MAAIMSCRTDHEVESIIEKTFYTCSDDVMIELEGSESSINVMLFKGKEFIASRTLLRDSLSGGRIFKTNDLTIALVNDSIKTSGLMWNYKGRISTDKERNRRVFKKVNYYITDSGALITTTQQSDKSIQLTLDVGKNTILKTILPNIVSASGAKYQDGDIVFWSKNNTAMLIYKGTIYGHCVRMYDDEIASDPCSNETLKTGVVAFLNDELKGDLEALTSNDRFFLAEYVDLNDDGDDEVCIALASSYFCGTGGCTWYLLNPDFTLITKFSVSDFPVYVSKTSSNGYRDLYVKSNGNYHELKYSGSSYPSNPSVETPFELLSKPEYTTAGVKRIFEQVYLKRCPF